MSNNLSQYKIDAKPKRKGIILVSNKGRIQTKYGKKTFGSRTNKGYMLCTTNKKQYGIHELVAHEFIGPRPTPLHTVDHVDDSFQGRSNNSSGNLQYLTPSEQSSKAWIKRKKNGSALTKKANPIQGKSINGNSWISYPSAASAARALGMKKNQISRVCRGEAVIKGYTFRVQPIEHIDSEEWRDVILVDGTNNTGWKISNFGRAMTQKGVVTMGSIYESVRGSESAYRSVIVNRTNQLIHRLVALAFLGAPPSPECNTVEHIDGNPSNNEVKNLRWFTMKQQFETRKADRKSADVALSKAVLGRLLCDDNGEWTKYSSASTAAKTLHLHTGNICHVCNGVYKSTMTRIGGVKYVFKWEDQDDIEGEIWRKVDFEALALSKLNKL